MSSLSAAYSSRPGVVALANAWLVPVRHRHLLSALVRRDWESRYRGSVLGLAWAFLVPIGLVAIYTLFFGSLLRVRVGTDASPLTFGLFVMCANLPWMAFTETIHRSTTVVADNRNLVKRVVFPLQVFPWMTTLAPVVNEMIGIAMFLLVVAVIQHNISAFVLLLPFVVAGRLLFCYGLALFLSSIGVFTRDLSHLLNIVLTGWMFLTPLFYPVDIVPEEFRWIVLANPLTWVVDAYRAVLLDGRVPDVSLLWLYGVGAILSAAGLAWFDRLSPTFPDVL